jgi:phage terminase large subunit
VRVQLPHNGWRPRKHQMRAWSYLENGGRHAELVWHRRAGKDEICLHWAAIAAHQRPATYWHMLPMASQARKAIWEAINPHTGKRRIDEAFPQELRATTRENEMLIKFKCGSTWQVVGSDNFNSLVGSPPAGAVFSEWALCNPAARAYLRPIFAENNGWQLYITTPRGKNHAHSTYTAALGDPNSFAEKLTANDTGILSPADLERERLAYIADFGEDMGDALFRQEYLCDWDAALLGAIYAREMRQADSEGRICEVPYDPAVPVETAWDIGRRDDTAIWFFQRVRGEKHFIDHYSASGLDIADFANVLGEKGYKYSNHWLPHDAMAKTFASNGKSTVEQLWALGVKASVVPSLSVQDGIQAARMVLAASWFDSNRCVKGLTSLRAYQRVWDADKKVFSREPLHNWASHDADAFRMAAIAMRDGDARPEAKPKPRFLNDMSLDELWARTPSASRRI